MSCRTYEQEPCRRIEDESKKLNCSHKDYDDRVDLEQYLLQFVDPDEIDERRKRRYAEGQATYPTDVSSVYVRLLQTA